MTNGWIEIPTSLVNDKKVICLQGFDDKIIPQEILNWFENHKNCLGIPDCFFKMRTLQYQFICNSCNNDSLLKVGANKMRKKSIFDFITKIREINFHPIENQPTKEQLVKHFEDILK